MTPRAEIAKRIWDQIPEAVYVTPEQFDRHLSGWTLEPHYVNDVMVMALMTRGSHVHFVTFGEEWSLTKADIKRYLLPVIAEHGFVETRTPHEDKRQQRFNRILGFKQVDSDEYFLHYRLDQLRHG